MGTLLGLPLHPLVVHAVVVLIPLTTAGVLLAVASPRWAERLRGVVAVLSVVGAASSVLARWSGQELLTAVPASPQTARHADLSDLHPWFAVASAALVVVWAWRSAGESDSRGWGWAAATAMAAMTVWTVLAGHSGAESVWG